MKLFRMLKTPRCVWRIWRGTYKGGRSHIRRKAADRKSDLNYQICFEANDIPNGISDVIICDGFTGNVVIKFGEGLGELLKNQFKEEYANHLLPKVGLLFMARNEEGTWKV